MQAADPLPDDYESVLTGPFIEKFRGSGDLFVDVGAHLGTWTLRMLPVFRRVVAFEPHPVTFEALQSATAPHNHVEVLKFAVGRDNGRADLWLYDRPGHSSVCGHPTFEELKRTPTGVIPVEVRALDKVLLPGRLSLLKVDTEGYEVDVLEGARMVIARYRPSLCIETHSVPLRVRCMEILTELGYDDLQVFPPVRHPNEPGWIVKV